MVVLYDCVICCVLVEKLGGIEKTTMHTQKCKLQNDGKYIYSPFLSHPNIFRAKKDKIVGLQIDIVLYTLHYRYETIVLFHKAYTGKCIFFFVLPH